MHGNVSPQDITYILKKNMEGGRVCMGAVSNRVRSLEVLIVQLKYFDRITHSRTPRKYRAAIAR